MNRKSCHIFFLAVCGMAATASAQELLTNGNFESMPSFGSGISGDAGYSALTGAQIPGWTIEPGHAVTIHNTVLYPTISGAYSVNTDGEGYNGVNADFYQSFLTTAGRRYTLRYDWQGWYNNNTQLTISLVDTVTAAILITNTYTYSGTLHHEALPFIGTGHTLRLRVREQTGYNDNTFMVDNFSVTPVPCGPDVGVQGGNPGQDGLLDNNDFVVFITFFFQQDARADFGRQGGTGPGDGLFDNNDFVVFIDQFFNGC